MRTLLIAAAAASFCGVAYAQYSAPESAPPPAAAAAPAAPMEAPLAMPAGPLVEVDNVEVVLWPGGPTAHRVEKAVILSAEGDRIGKIEKVLMTPDGVVSAVSVDLRRRYGDREVVIWLDQLTPQGNDFVVVIARADIEALPAWEG